jgi:hypothetical protein
MHSRRKLKQVTTVAKLVDHRSDPQQKKDKDNNNNNNNSANCRRLEEKLQDGNVLLRRSCKTRGEKHAL